MSSFDKLLANMTDDLLLSEALEEIIFEHREEVLDLVRIQLEQFGVDGANKPITPEYTPYTVQIKRSKGQRTDHVTLLDKGGFHNSFFITFFGTKDRTRAFETNASDSKASDLAAKYGDEIIDLNETSVQILIDEIIKPNLARKLLQKWLRNI